jgi:uncharacterized damage-inducible protein DinB
VIAELENIPEEHWEYRPGAGGRTVREIARHIAEAGRGFALELVRPDGRFARLLNPEHQAKLRAELPEVHSKNDILDLLRTTGTEGVQQLRQGGSLETQRFPALGGEQSRLSGLWFAISHEMYHRGQLASYARALGRVPMLTQQIEAFRAARTP